MTTMVDSTAASESSSPAWIQDNQTMGVIIGFFVIALYVAPVFIIGAVAWHTQGGFVPGCVEIRIFGIHA